MNESAAGRPVVSLKNVRWLRLDEIADLWSVEIGVAPSIILRELRLALINLPRLAEGKGLIEEIPSQLPAPDSLMSQEEMYGFCEKEGHWPRPKFWFGESMNTTSFPGRPSIMSAILQELDRAHKNGELKDSLAKQSRALVQWASEVFPANQRPTVKTTENNIRHIYKAYKHSTAPK
jgi:hypothetical protein